MTIGGISTSYHPYMRYGMGNEYAANYGIGKPNARVSGIGAVGNVAPVQPVLGVSNRADETGQSADKRRNVKAGYKSSPAECKTCKERKYQDGSNESDVSFKSPGHISPGASASTVMAHEQQHVANAHQKAAEKNGKVISAAVSLHTSVCPECGTSYVSGGTTRTSISYPNESNPYQKNQKAQDAIRLVGANIDYVA